MLFVEPKSNFLRVVEALTKCNFITINHIKVKYVNKDSKLVKIVTEDEDSGEEFITTFVDTTPLTILDNSASFESSEGEEMTLRFFTQSKYFL